MRALIVVALLAFGYASAKSVSSPRAFEDIIIDTLECVRGEMALGWPEWGIPHLNPLVIEDHTFVYDDLGRDGVTGELTLQDLTFFGLINFTYDELSGTIGLMPPSYTITVTLGFAKLDLETNYKNDFVVAHYHAWGEGTLNFVANNFHARIDLKATILGGIKLEYFNLSIGMDPLSEFVITGAHDDEQYSANVSNAVMILGHIIVDELSEILNEVVGEIVLREVNEGGLADEDGFVGGIIDRCLGGR